MHQAVERIDPEGRFFRIEEVRAATTIRGPETDGAFLEDFSKPIGDLAFSSLRRGQRDGVELFDVCAEVVDMPVEPFFEPSMSLDSGIQSPHGRADIEIISFLEGETPETAHPDAFVSPQKKREDVTTALFHSGNVTHDRSVPEPRGLNSDPSRGG